MWPSPKCDIMNRNPELVDIDSNFNYVFTMVFSCMANLLYPPLYSTCCTFQSTNRMISNVAPGSCITRSYSVFFFSFFLFVGLRWQNQRTLPCGRFKKKRENSRVVIPRKFLRLFRSQAVRTNGTVFYLKCATSGWISFYTVHKIWKCILWWTYAL